MISPMLILFERAARCLVGRPVRVRLQPPIIKSFDGQAYDYKGVATVDIKPGFDDKTTLYIFCHECAHIKAGHGAVMDPDQAPGSLDLTVLGAQLRKVHPLTRGQEDGADSMAATWQEYANQHYKEYTGDTTLARQLRALAGYIPPEVQA